MKNKIIIPKQILTLLVLAVTLIIARYFIFHSLYYLYLLWNIFLAILPFVISSTLLWYFEHKLLTRPLLFIGGIFWLLLLPNAPYIVTDLIHLGRNHGVPLIYDTFLTFTSAWVGLLLGMHSLRHIEKILITKYKQKKVASIIAFIILLESFGIYLGRFLRFNSWDIFSNPIEVLGNIGSVFIHPTLHADAYIFTLLSFTFFYLAYRSWKYSVLEAKQNI